MAITINNAPENDVLVSGFNPYFIKFETDLGTPTNAIITFTRVGNPNIDTFINITPDNDGVFLFNFQGLFRDVESNSNNYFASTHVIPDISTISNSLFIDPFLNTKIITQIGIYNGDSLIDSITAELAPEYYFTRGSSQVLNSPFQFGLSNTVNNPNSFVDPLSSTRKVNVWSGFPFDFQLDALDSTNINVQNGSTFFNKTLDCSSISRTLRLTLIDHLGNEFTGLSNNSNNDLEINLLGGTVNLDAFLNPVYKTVSCPEDSRYFRFVNSKGGDSYWLFSNNYVIQKKRSNKKRINRNFTDLATASSRSVSLGSDITDTLIVSHTTQEEYENILLRDLINSPVIEMWMGGQKWLRVELINHNGDEKSRRVSTQFNFSFDLGTIYNQSI